MSQLSEIPGDNSALQAEAEALVPFKRGRKATLSREERLARIKERNRINRLIWSMPPANLKCDCNEPATLWNNARDAVCARCDFLYSMAKRMEIQGRTLGLNRKLKSEAIIVETQLELFSADVVYLADEITIIGHGVYHLSIKEAP